MTLKYATDNTAQSRGGLMYHYRSCAVVLIALMGGQTVTASADSALIAPVSQPKQEEVKQVGWSFNASPYFWGAGISGTVGQFGLPPAKMTSNFKGILKDLDFSFMGVIEGHYDRYSLFSDVIYTKISSGGQTPYGVLSNGIDIKSETFSGLFGGGYSVFEEGLNRLDIVAGGRFWYASTEISFEGGMLDGQSGRDSATWVDAVAGLRGKYFFTDSFYASGWGVVGAGQAKIDWDVAGTFGYKFKDNLSAVAGYRALGVDFDHDGFVYDVVQKGPILGLVVHF